MNRLISSAAVAATFLSCLPSPAFAHMTLEHKEANIGSSYMAVLNVPHGCGDAATTALRVQIPEGFHSVKPMPHAGWELKTVTGTYAHTYKNHGSEVTEGVVEVSWSGGHLPDAHFDQFTLRGTFADTFSDGDIVYFPAVQECENGESLIWVATADDSEGDPAPQVTLRTAAGTDEHAGHGAHAGHDMTDEEMVGHSYPVTLGDLEIRGGFARATLPAAPVGGGYITIVNNGSGDDTLIAAASDVAGEVQLHNMTVENDIMKMFEMEDGIPLLAGETVTLAPGGMHLMFMQLNQPLVEGETVTVTLTFEQAGTVDVVLDIGGIGASGAMDHSSHGDMTSGEHNHG